jgi:hypothetical protein
MTRSADRILTTHVGSLPRTQQLIEFQIVVGRLVFWA